jgi:thiamine biosynthesis lipoprotein
VKAELARAAFEALGTTAAVASEGDRIDAALADVRAEIEAIDRTCSRFRDDSDLSRVNASAGEWTRVDPLLIDAVEVAVRAARITDGAVDPSVGRAMIRLGYDRDFRRVAAEGPAVPMPVPAASSRWRGVEIRRASSEIRIPDDVALDLGATGKAFAADRAATRAATTTGGGVLVGLGGDISVAGPAPANGWSIGIAEDHAARPERGETISITAGGVATSTTTVRAWRRGSVRIHHVVDPRTGLPARAPWRTVSVCANTCVDANTASTAAIVLGEAAVDWLARQRLPARMVRSDGSVVRLGGWPERRWS